VFAFDDAQGKEIVEVCHVAFLGGFEPGLGDCLLGARGWDAGEECILPVRLSEVIRNQQEDRELSNVL